MADLLQRLQAALGTRLTLLREVGRGGMATVFLAEEQHPRRQVAVKVLDPDLANSLTIYNASSTPRTLAVMLVIALVGMPLVILYTAYIYRTFRGRTVLTADSY